MKHRLSIVTALLLAVQLAAANGAERIGIAAMVQDQVTGSVGGQTVTLATGDSVFSRQVIKANTNGRAQLIFVDETVFSVGAGATVTLDEFIYDPNRKTGNVVLNVSKGAFRFISGASRPETYSIKTPVATIGIRGTIFSGNVISANYMTLNLQKGRLLICPERGKRIEGNLSKQKRQREGRADCTLVEPGDFRIGSSASPPPAGDPNVFGTEPNEGIDAIDIPARCVVRFGIPFCS